MKHIMRTSTCFCAAAALSAMASVTAFGQGGSLPTTASCNSWSSALTSGGATALDALNNGWFGGCASTGPNALASAISASRTSNDTIYLRALVQAASRVRHPLIFNAAVQVAADWSNTVRARAASYLILGAQLGGGTKIVGLTTPNELTVALPAKGVCGVSTPVFMPEEPANQPLPADAGATVSHQLDNEQILSDQPELLRNLARCVRTVVSPDVPPQINVGSLTVQYVCGNTFVVHNPIALNLPLTFNVEGTSERFSLTAFAGKDLTVYARVKGSLQLIYNGLLISTTANGNTVCP